MIYRRVMETVYIYSGMIRDDHIACIRFRGMPVDKRQIRGVPVLAHHCPIDQRRFPSRI